jgi:hypothetical protein
MVTVGARQYTPGDAIVESIVGDASVVRAPDSYFFSSEPPKLACPHEYSSSPTDITW